VMKCKDCEEEIEITEDAEEGDIISCKCCGLEYEVKIVNGAVQLLEFMLEGLDWGE
jgi:hypothetical protein